jgi:archaellum component FlaF (FlaF/FlaG flagellin family)
MARTSGLHAFTVQEATNYEAYTSWNHQTADVSGDSVAVTSTYITAANPAKKVVIYSRGGAVDAADSITITLNGESGTGKPIIVDGENLPFTITGLTITSLSFTIPDGETDADEVIDILSFH